MRLPHLSPPSLRALLLLGPPGLSAAHGSTEASLGASTGLCEARTINYITHTLPQLCLPTAWSASPQTVGNATTAAPATGTSQTGSTIETSTATATPGTRPEEAPAENSTQAIASTDQVAQDGQQGTHEGDTTAKQAEEDSEDLATESFMSFDEWKAMMLKKSGQDLADLKDRKRREARDADPGVGGGLDGWGEDGEISLDFDVLSDKISEMTATGSSRAGSVSTNVPNAEVQDTTVYDNGVAHYHRPKDAGKTCKERFSYSSFDGGATVLKTSPGAQNSKAILVENKDSYMLFTCSQENKFVIVELSEDILVDTVVLANFEFFSSMIRSFRISVSDKYPVKMEKWKDLGTFQARNSRDIQSFLIENPKIWAKYIRIELLSHFGNEYYCPVSLLRVHGTRMLDSWKDGEAGLEDDEPVETIAGPEAVPEEESMHQSALEAEVEPTHAAETAATIEFGEISLENGLSPWYPPLFNDSSYDTCAIGTPTMTETLDVSPSASPNSSIPSSSRPALSTEDSGASATAGNSTVASTVASSPALSSSISTNTPSNPSTSSAPHTPKSNRAADTVANTTQTIQKIVEADIPKSSVTPPKAAASSKTQTSPSSKHASKAAAKNSVAGHPSQQPSKTNSQNKGTTNTSSSVPASPTVQESFFKSVSKRLQFLESNTTLSLQYIEEQSKFLQEALKKMERKQISRVDSFLNNLNSTVFSELRRVRQDYDQIWQSTVIALETQREQSQRDIIALRDEVIFQKRMAIFQSVLLLCCLVLVVFSRGVFGGGGTSADQWPITSTSQFINSYLGSPRWPPGSPQSISRSNTPDRNGNVGMPQPAGAPAPVPRHGVARRRVSYADKVLPLTPTSEEFDSNDNGTPPPPLPRPHPQTAPKIRINELTPDEEYFDRDRLDQGSDGTSTATPQAFEPVREDPMSSIGMEVGEDEEGDDEDDFSDSASAPYLDSRETTMEVEYMQRIDDPDDDMTGPSRPPLARSPLSELGAESSRKPLPALPEQDPP
ncbi:UNC-like C-terminal-domain-containing protein [Diaporthe sp. PMI_573]|nr:UNC-like C-terminal-domain-containing protein [Diaporthaceae sp. PMI_573]